MYAMLPICSNFTWPPADGLKSCQHRLQNVCEPLRNPGTLGVKAVPLPLPDEMNPFEHTVSVVVDELAPTGIDPDSVTDVSVSSPNASTCAVADGVTYVVVSGSAR